MKTLLVCAAAVMCFMLASCAGDAEPDPPATLALVDSPPTTVPPTTVPTATVPTATNAGLPEGLDAADLPELLDDRVTAMNQWLQRHEPALNSGHGQQSANPGGTFSVEQLVNTASRDEAERLCPLYVAASEFFAGSAGSPREVVLMGWALGDDGLFFEPGWTPISCDLEG